MIKGKKVLGLVTARGGSKGLPGKNLMKIGGMSLVCRAVRAGLESRYIDDVVISTDDEAIASEAAKCGCEVPFMRPAELASDSAKSIDVIRHALTELGSAGREYGVFVLLQPTTPFRTAAHVDGCLEMLAETDADSVVSVTEAEHHPMWMNTLPADMSMKDFIRPEAENKNRQELPTYYRINGGVYAVCTEMMLRTNRLYSQKSYAYLMDAESSVDIDTPLDFALAEIIAEKNKI
jgi:CMP-N-acetylneuraminic acid synthetase